jgi:hypothetical protein
MPFSKKTPIEIKHYPVFEKGTFQKHPELLDRFFHHASSYLIKKFNRARAILTEYEGDITWPLITGPGFSAGTHPGSDSILINTMFEAYRFVYNSDCLYINPLKRIFAVSDPPGLPHHRGHYSSRWTGICPMDQPTDLR